MGLSSRGVQYREEGSKFAAATDSLVVSSLLLGRSFESESGASHDSEHAQLDPPWHEGTRTDACHWGACSPPVLPFVCITLF